MAGRSNPQAFFDQQYGNSTWRDCTPVLQHLTCKEPNTFNYHTILANSSGGNMIENLYRDTPIFACKFAPHKGSEHLIALANEDGKLAIHNSKDQTGYGTQAHNNAVFDLAWKFDQLKLVTASGDHTLKLHDMGNGEINTERTFYGHARSVKTVTFRKDEVFASGGRDGNIILWDSRASDYNVIGNPDQTIVGTHCSRAVTPLAVTKPQTPGKTQKRRPPALSLSMKSVTGLAFQDENTLISCGAGDGVIKIWDLRKNYNIGKRESNPKYTLPYAGNTSRNGFSCLLVDDAAVRLYANCLDNSIYCYNIATYNPKPMMRYTGHQNSTFYIKSSLCKDGNYLLSGSSDESAYIWNVKKSHPAFRLTGHTAEVTCVAWCYNDHKLITCSDDMTYKLWTIETGIKEKWRETNGVVKDEVVALKQPAKRRFTIADSTAGGTPKKAAASCRACDTVGASALCENCQQRLKRGRLQEEMCQMFAREMGPKRLFGGWARGEGRTEEGGEVPPTKFRRVDGSPSKIADSAVSSPTVNLPNYVVDGTAPHLTYSPPPKKKKADDWLTRLRIERSLRQEMLERTAGPSGERFELSPRRDQSPRSEQSIRPKTSTPCTARTSLLRFFKVSNGKCEAGPCPFKSHNCNVMISGTQLNP